MDNHATLPQVFHVLEVQALEVQPSPYGAVGTLFSGDGLEAVWISKENEAIDSGWFSQDSVDLLVVLQGQLRIEFAHPDLPVLATSDICSGNGPVLHDGESMLATAVLTRRNIGWPKGPFPLLCRLL